MTTNDSYQSVLRIVAIAMTTGEITPADAEHVTYEVTLQGIHFEDVDGFFGNVEAFFSSEELAADYDMSEYEIADALSELGFSKRID